MNTVEELLSNIAPIPDVKSTKRHSYIIIGKPGSGKTTLATRLSEITRSQLVNIDTSFQNINKATQSPYQQIKQTLTEGGVVNGETIYESLKSQLTAESLHTKGFVLEGLPLNIKSPNLFDQIDHLVSVIQKFNCVLIDLRISDQDLLRRRAASWVDPVTNISYPGQQVIYSRQRRRDGWTDGEEDTVYIAERNSNSSSAKPKPPVEDNDGDERQEKSEDVLGPPRIFKNQISYPILSEKILDRLIKLPENDPDKVSEELIGYKRIDERMEELKRKYFNALQTVDLDATQHPEQVFDQMKARMDARGYSIYTPLYEVFKLTPPEQSVSDILEADLIKFYLNAGIREGEPERELGLFKKNCPVTWVNENKLVEGKGDLCAVYKGKIYFFGSEEDLNLFTTYPDKYTSSQLNIPSCKLAFIGIPLPFKNSVARSVAEKYKLGYINPEDSILEWEKSQWEVLNSDDEDLKEVANQVFNQLRIGGSVTSEQYITVIEFQVKKHLNEHKKLFKKDGWVLDGFPCSEEQVRLLASKDLLPQTVFNIKADYSDISIQNAIKKLSPIPTSRSSFVIHEATPFSELASNVHSNENMETLRELSEKFVATVNINWTSSQLAILTKVLETLDIFVPQALPLKSLGTIPIFGATKDYCPVTIKNSNKLLKGDQNFVAKFMGFVYYFASEEAKSEFCSQPYYYIRDVKIPPRRIIVFGASGSGRNTIILNLSKKWNLPILNFSEFCFSNDFGNLQIKASAQSKTPLPSEAVLQILSKLYMEEPYANQGFILKGFPFSKSDLDLLLKQKMSPDAFLILQVDSAIAAKRKLPQVKKDNAKAEEERLKKLDAANPIMQSLIKTDDKLMEELVFKIEQENNAISDYTALLDAWGSLNTIKISTGRCFRPVMAEIEKELAPFLNNRKDLLLSTYTLDEKAAKNLLEYGVKTFSRLGKYCPVTIFNGGLVNPTNFGTTPVQCGDSLYFVKSKHESQFSTSPSLYISQRQPQPVMASNCCIVGNPKSGKSALAELLSRELDAIYLTVATILQTILDGNEITSLCEKIRKILQSGKPLNDQIIVDSIVTITNRIAASGKGWILDGFPTTIDQALLLEKANFQPHYVFNISLPESAITARAIQDLGSTTQNGLPVLNGVDIHISRNAEWKKCLEFTKNLYQSKYSNWVDLDGLRSKWSLKQEAIALSLKALHRRQTYLQLKTEGKAAPAADVGLSNAFILKHRSKFQEYCPYQLVEFTKLNTDTTRYYSEYQGYYYCLSSQEALNAFLRHPEKYIAHNLPEILPKVSSKSELVFPKKLQLLGYCPVTFEQGPTGSIVPGNPDYIAEYNSEMYTFASKENLQAFMATPWKFANLKLPKKLPPPISPIPIKGLPISGYLEQALATSLAKSLVALGKARPKHPFKEIDQSACEFLGLYLKANNPSTKDWVRKSHNRKLALYISHCDLMKDFMNKIPTESSLNSELESKVNTILSFSKSK